jgi:RimJ/RimL family protein N-acetyltransferase
MSITILQTPRLRVRLATPMDRDMLHMLEQDPEVMRYLNGGHPTPLEPLDPDTSPYRMPRGHDPDVWAVIEQGTERLVGWVALYIECQPLLDPAGELGYRFFRDVWGRGYASEASRALVNHAFEDPGLTHVIARTMAANTASRRVMERLGMQQTATDNGDVTYTVTRSAWRA